jgi:hypothetical protein
MMLKAFISQRRIWRSAWAVVAAAALSGAGSEQGTIPARLSDQEFWRMVSEFSEPGGYFRSENFVGNETSLQHTLHALGERVPRGGVYLGVAPDQNFTFISALRPRMAFILDIRRQNLVQHMFYKAAMELSPTRAEFLSLIFSRARPEGLAANASVDSLVWAFYTAPPSRSLFEHNLRLMRDRLTRVRGFALTDQDTTILTHIAETFFRAGLDITYNTSGGGGGGRGGGMPTYGSMVAEVDLQGSRRSYLASEQNYTAVRNMQMNNLIVPVVGDFAGPRALRTIGQYVRERGATVTTFYTSNVEQYLFQGPDEWARFYSNMATLPLDSTSTLIRSAPNNNARMAGVSGWPGSRSTMLISPMQSIVAAFRAGRIVSYTDVLALSR